MQDRGEKLSPSVEEQLCFEMKTILLAGHETSAAMLTWTLLELTRNPDCMQKVLRLMQHTNMSTHDACQLVFATPEIAHYATGCLACCVSPSFK